MTPPVRYLSADEDSARWEGFAFREGDIVVSTRSKSGTTWMQMICALLVFGDARLPAPLSQISPWLDFLVTPLDEVVGELEAQTHRRIIKTHTPLDGLPLDPRATFVVVAREPLDMAVSLYHQGDNIDRERMAALTGRPAEPQRERPSPGEWLTAWVEADHDPRERMDSLSGVLHHVADAWARREQSNVELVHYADLSADLEAEMRRLAERLGFVVDDDAWPDLVEAAGFSSMRERATALAPARGILKDPAAFFRGGRSGAGREVLAPAKVEAYQARVLRALGADAAAWLLRG